MNTLPRAYLSSLARRSHRWLAARSIHQRSGGTLSSSSLHPSMHAINLPAYTTRRCSLSVHSLWYKAASYAAALTRFLAPWRPYRAGPSGSARRDRHGIATVPCSQSGHGRSWLAARPGRPPRRVQTCMGPVARACALPIGTAGARPRPYGGACACSGCPSASRRVVAVRPRACVY